MKPEAIGNNELAVEMLPALDDRESVFVFAMSFNGYEYAGSFDESAKKARAMSRKTLDEIRNELFFSARASRHRGDDLFMETYQELRPHLVSILESKSGRE